jgi:transposase
MSDRFDMMLERKLETKPDGGDEPVVGVRRIELITGTARRREWSDREKARILLESAEPGANISDVARRNGLSPQQLFGWRREARALLADAVPPIEAASPRSSARTGGGKTKVRGTPAPAVTRHFAPVVLVAPGAAPPASPSQPSDKTRGLIEIVIGDAIVRVVGKVDRGALAEVLAALRHAEGVLPARRVEDAPPARWRAS